MKMRMLACGFVVGAGLVLACTEVLSQDRGGDVDPAGGYDPATMQEMMEKWQQVAAPGEAHERLARQEGEWEITSRMWPAGHGNPPEESTGTARTKLIFGGRFLETHQTGSFMNMPYEGRAIVGYDNFKKKYTTFWIDSNGTAMYTGEGMADQTGKVITYYGTMDEWMTGEHDKPVKYVDRQVDPDTRIFEIHDLGIVPGETKVVEMVYRRRR